ncbi:hypothetical protein AB7W11_17370 [Providencia manganoxydans]|uniref:hypothetical protein n=1 Tax=Providencia manganoxydans TaxID=2923283 RepID=UPI0034E3D104
MNNWAIISSKMRVYQALVLIDSIIKNGDKSNIYVLSMDDESYEIISSFTQSYANVFILKEENVINDNIRDLKNTRHYFSYCWTLKSIFCMFILDLINEHDCVTYTDSDLFFMGNASSYLSSKDYSVFFTFEEQFLPKNKHDKKKEYNNIKSIVGDFNSGFISFKKDAKGKQVLSWWQNKCIESCDVNDVTFGDQKYLNEVPSLFDNVFYEPSTVINIGPWNVLKREWKRRNNDVFFGENKALVYHFSGFKIKNPDTICFLGGIKVHESDYFSNNESSRLVYNIYNELIIDKVNQVSRAFPFFYGYTDSDNNDWSGYLEKNNILGISMK